MGGGGAIAPKGICKSDPLHMYSLGGCQAEEATATGGISSRGMQRLKRPRGTWPCCQSPFCFVSFKGPKQITGENLESKGGDCIGLARKGHSGFSILAYKNPNGLLGQPDIFAPLVGGAVKSHTGGYGYRQR